jgi:hypothetical protein
LRDGRTFLYDFWFGCFHKLTPELLNEEETIVTVLRATL